MANTPRSLTSTALLLRSPVWCTVVSLEFEIGDPSLPFVILKRFISNLEALAISWNICVAEASELTVMDSGRFLIGRPGRINQC